MILAGARNIRDHVSGPTARQYPGNLAVGNRQIDDGKVRSVDDAFPDLRDRRSRGARRTRYSGAAHRQAALVCRGAMGCDDLGRRVGH